jgi:chemotaxis protein MotC
MTRVARGGAGFFAKRLAIAFGAIALAASAPPAPADIAKVEPLNIEALPLPRTGAQPLHIIRRMSALQDRISAGDVEISERLEVVVADIDRQLKAFPVDVWKDARNRFALIKFTLSGGNPERLRSIAEKRLFIEAEIPLALGALAYAEGHRKIALTYLAKVDTEKLGPSLAGQVTFIKAIVTAETDIPAALRLSDLARLLSPGTLVEEAALRFSIELNIATGDKQSLETSSARYVRRFQKSKFATAVLSQIAAFAAAYDYPATPKRKAWLERFSSELGLERRAEFFVVMAESGLRFGKLATAAYAARIAAASGADHALVLAYEGAAMAVSPDPTQGLALMSAAEAFSLSTTTNELVVAARFVGAMIEAPPGAAVGPPPAALASSQSENARNAIMDADKLLKEMVE